MFSKSFVINLPFKFDRLATFQASIPACLGPIEVWPAVHGDSVSHPDWWKSGRGAWGCYRSHLQILEHCYQRKDSIESYLVFEDDAIFREGFDALFRQFMADLPADWEVAYLGGQLLDEINHPPKQVTPNVFVPWNVNRTHCFAVHRRGYEKMYKHLNSSMAEREHIDHHLGRLHESGAVRVYCPAKWLVGQDGGPSNISGNTNAPTYWVDPEKLAQPNRQWTKREVPVVFLEAPNNVAIELDRRHWHRGHWRNEEQLDRGVCEALTKVDCRSGLIQWYKTVLPEAVREGHKCVCLYHPSLSWACVQSLEGCQIHRIIAKSTDEAESQLKLIVESLEADKESPEKRVRRNLIYHIWPKRDNGVWQWNVTELRKRIDQFDGVRSIAVVVDSSSDTLEDVQRAFEGVRVDNWIVHPNDPKLGEVVSFRHLLDTVKSEPGITFYSHAKSVNYEFCDTHRLWAEMMYEICLDDRQHVDSAIQCSTAAGPFLREKPTWMDDQPTGWHFSGTFFWFNNEKVFANEKWKEIHPWYYGTEMWLGRFVAREDANCLFGHGCGNLWVGDEYQRMKTYFEQWKEARRPREVSISVVIPTIGRESLVGMVDSLLSQLSPIDEILVVADGFEALERARICLESIKSPLVHLLEEHNVNSCFGHSQRNYGWSHAKGEVIWFCDDDDIVLPGASTAIRKELAKEMRPTIFRQINLGHLIWNRQEIAEGNTGTPQVIVPNDDRCPRFAVPTSRGRSGDIEWAEAVNGWKPARWVETVIYEAQFAGFGKLASEVEFTSSPS